MHSRERGRRFHVFSKVPSNSQTDFKSPLVWLRSGFRVHPSSVQHDSVSHLAAVSVRRWHHSMARGGGVGRGGACGPECSPH